jgi:hypothetical protein
VIEKIKTWLEQLPNFECVDLKVVENEKVKLEEEMK